MECEHEGAINTVNNKYKINKGKKTAFLFKSQILRGCKVPELSVIPSDVTL